MHQKCGRPCELESPAFSTLQVHREFRCLSRSFHSSPCFLGGTLCDASAIKSFFVVHAWKDWRGRPCELGSLPFPVEPQTMSLPLKIPICSFSSFATIYSRSSSTTFTPPISLSSIFGVRPNHSQDVTCNVWPSNWNSVSVAGVPGLVTKPTLTPHRNVPS